MNKEILHSLDHGVGVVVVHKSKVLLMHRAKDTPFIPDKWDFLGGGIEDGETALEAAHRELLEESGISVQQMSFLGAVEGGSQEGKPYFLTLPTDRDVEAFKMGEEGQDVRFLDADEVINLHVRGSLAGPLLYVFIEKNKLVFLEMIRSGTVPKELLIGLNYKG